MGDFPNHIVYNDGRCTVEVHLFPNLRSWRNLVHHLISDEGERPFARVILDTSGSGDNNVWDIFLGDEVTYSGHFWWRKTISSTQEERLENAVIDAIRLAERTSAKFKEVMASGNQAVENSKHLISAIKEVTSIAGEHEE